MVKKKGISIITLVITIVIIIILAGVIVLNITKSECTLQIISAFLMGNLLYK